MYNNSARFIRMNPGCCGDSVNLVSAGVAMTTNQLRGDTSLSRNYLVISHPKLLIL